MSAEGRANGRAVVAPRKAYIVEKISRCTVSVLVHANSAADAKRRVREGDYAQALDADYQLRGFGRVHRCPSDDLEELPA